ncbi:MAG: ion channel [Pseudomonadota bacterium]
MFAQLLIGSLIIIVTVVVVAPTWWGLEVTLARSRHWLRRPPYGPRLTVMLCVAMLWSLLTLTLAVWVWAVALWVLGIFVAFETSVYFSLVAFTTLGFGDILIPQDWRLLGGMAAANGLLIFGLLAAMLVEAFKQVRAHALRDD